MPATTTTNEQVVEAVVSGPDTANRLYTCTGQAILNMQAQVSAQPPTSAQPPVPETWTFLVGPQLQPPSQRFIRATASVSVAGYEVSSVGVASGTISSSHSLNIQSVEADLDEESGKTELRVEVAIGASGTSFTLAKIGFTATVLAEVT
jgi:hypothetical protein